MRHRGFWDQAKRKNNFQKHPCKRSLRRQPTPDGHISARMAREDLTTSISRISGANDSSAVSRVSRPGDPSSSSTALHVSAIALPADRVGAARVRLQGKTAVNPSPKAAAAAAPVVNVPHAPFVSRERRDLMSPLEEIDHAGFFLQFDDMG